jgi:hypothetical protein
MSTLKSTIFLPQLSFELNLPIIQFDPSSLGDGWGIQASGWDPPYNDGISGFPEALAKAALMSKADALDFLFPTRKSFLLAMAEGIRLRMSAFERLSASPHLGWSLLKEDDQKTLRFLNDVFGVTWIDFSHQHLYLRTEGGRGDDFYIFFCFRYGDQGMWSWGAYPDDGPRDDDYRMVAF